MRREQCEEALHDKRGRIKYRKLLLFGQRLKFGRKRVVWGNSKVVSLQSIVYDFCDSSKRCPMLVSIGTSCYSHVERTRSRGWAVVRKGQGFLTSWLTNGLDRGKKRVSEVAESWATLALIGYGWNTTSSTRMEIVYLLRQLDVHNMTAEGSLNLGSFAKRSWSHTRPKASGDEAWCLSPSSASETDH